MKLSTCTTSEKKPAEINYAINRSDIAKISSKAVIVPKTLISKDLK